MGLPVWAQTGEMESTSRTRGFPVHRLESSPLIATYTQEREGNSIPTIPTNTTTTTQPDQSPPVSPGEIVWKIKTI